MDSTVREELYVLQSQELNQISFIVVKGVLWAMLILTTFKERKFRRNLFILARSRSGQESKIFVL